MPAEIEHLERDIDRQQGDISTIKDALYTLIEAQRNTTKNVDNLTQDMKEVIRAHSNFDTVEAQITSVEKRIKKIEETKTWEYRIFIGTVITGVVALVTKFGLL